MFVGEGKGYELGSLFPDEWLKNVEPHQELYNIRSGSSEFFPNFIASFFL